MTDHNQQGMFWGVGVGPGDPELITLKAARIIKTADVICYLVNDKDESQSLFIAQTLVDERDHAAIHYPIYMPMSRDPNVGSAVYDAAAVKIAEYIRSGKHVVFLCEGDPLFFGSFAYLLERLESACVCQVIPGITSPQSASAVLQNPLTILKESYAVISGRHNDDIICQTLLLHDTVVIMKAGMARPRLLALLKETKRFEDGQYLEYIGRENQRIISDLSLLPADSTGPYFSLFLVTQKNRGRA
ncbi:precorrin-2 C(20)-methyltransferase [Pseudomonas sp. HK3]